MYCMNARLGGVDNSLTENPHKSIQNIPSQHCAGEGNDDERFQSVFVLNSLIAEVLVSELFVKNLR